MADYVSIANMALSKIGEDDQLKTPGDDKHSARTIAAVWDTVRQAAIRDHSWNFAMKRAALSAEALDAVPYPYAYSYPLPADNLRLIEVLNIGRKAYALEGEAILCNQAGPIHIRYLRDVTETARWDAGFVAAFAAQLALQIGRRIAGSDYDEIEGHRAYLRALSSARRKDALENPPVQSDLSGWEIAHLGGAPSYAAGWGE